MKTVNSYKVEEKSSNSIILDANESPFNYDPSRIAFIIKRLNAEELNRYPDTDSNKLRELYAKYVGVNKENLIAGHGSDEMLSLIISRYISKGKRLFTLAPDFSMYDFYVSLNEGEVIKYKTRDDGTFDVNNFIEYGIDNRVDLVMFSNPNNPTGNVVSIEDIELILTAFKDTKVVVDEAYVEFYGKSTVELIDKYSNLIVTRTLSKAWGLASLRVGFLISNEGLVSELNNYKVPFNVSEISQVIACNILENESVDESIEKIMNWKEQFYKELKEIEMESSIDISFYKGNANFIYGRSPYKEDIISTLTMKKVKIRSFKDDTFRITVGVPSQNKIVIDAIKKTCIYEEAF
ncbi:MAG: histidinol-phosphate transaminase [Clostridium sp.]